MLESWLFGAQRTHHAVRVAHADRMLRARTPAPVAALIVAGVCWGSSYAVVGFVADTNPMILTGSRFAVFGVL